MVEISRNHFSKEIIQPLNGCLQHEDLFSMKKNIISAIERVQLSLVVLMQMHENIYLGLSVENVVERSKKWQDM